MIIIVTAPLTGSFAPRRLGGDSSFPGKPGLPDPAWQRGGTDAGAAAAAVPAFKLVSNSH